MFRHTEQMRHVWGTWAWPVKSYLLSVTLTCSPSGWWQSWLRPSGCRSPAAVEWFGFPAALSPAETKQHNNRIQSPCSLWENVFSQFSNSRFFPQYWLDTAGIGINWMKKGIKLHTSASNQRPHFYLHGLELLVAALCFGLHAPHFFLHGGTLFSHHCLHPACLLLLNLKLLKHRIKMEDEPLHRNKWNYSCNMNNKALLI